MLSRFSSRLLMLFFSLLWLNSAFAIPELLPFQGRLTDSTGAPINYPVTVKYRIYPPSGSCYLYEDTQSITPNAYGLFTVLLGAAGTKSFSGAGVNFRDVFSNTVAGGLPDSCTTVYTPAVNDWRRIEIVVDGTPMPDMQTIAASPFSIESRNSAMLGGKAATSYLQVNGSLTQAAAEALVAGGDASTYHNHDSLYIKTDGSYTGNIVTSSNIYTTNGRVGIGTSSALADLDIEKASPSVRLAAATGGGGSSKIDFYSGAATQRASIQSSESTNELKFYTGTTEAVRIDGSQNAFFSSSLSANGTFAPGKYTSAQETSTLLPSLTAGGAGSAGTFWVNTTGVLKYWDGSAIQVLASKNSVVNSVIAGTGVSITGTAINPVINVAYGTTAGTAIEGNASFSGDVSGNYTSLSVDKIKGTDVCDRSGPSGSLYNGSSPLLEHSV